MTTQAAEQTEPTTHLPCRRCGVPVEMAVWMLSVAPWPVLRDIPKCPACCAATRHERVVAAREGAGA